MALQQRLSLSPKLSQRLVLTPAMQQAIKLLPLTTLELADVINQEMIENPLLEEIPEDELTGPAPETDSEGADGSAVAEPEFDGDLGSAEAVPGALEGPGEAPPAETNLELAPEPQLTEQTSLQDSDIDKLFENVVDDIGVRDMAQSDPDSEYSIENRLSTTIGLRDHLMAQLRHDANPGRVRDLGEAIIQNLDDDGYLRTHDPSCEASDHAACGKIVPTTLDEICVGMDLDPEAHRGEVEKALALVQTFDPAGVGARDLRECLLIQLRFFGFSQTPAATIVESHMRALEMRDVAGLVRVLGRPEAEVLDWLDLIEGLDPRPGSTLSAKAPSYVVPDVMIFKKDGEFVVELNDDSLPRLRISSSYRQFLSAGSPADDEAKTYVRDKMRSALFLIKSVDQRQRTLYKVADSIVKRQSGFFEHGVSALKPMVLRDVADDISMHESTVSRIVQNKHAHTPQGVLPLKYFFHSGLKGDSGESVSSVAIKEKIRHMIDAETPGKPLSDAQIGQVLSYQGTTIARRTVAKYREEMRIPSSSERKGRPR
ncbi:MAG: RNA polymerase factor sigma-54 [Vicinamibacteria bacterium]